jgi:hypothetical protein
MKSQLKHLVGCLCITFAVASLAGCAVDVVDEHGYSHHGYYDWGHHWHGGYYDEGHVYHNDPDDWHK